MVNRGFSVVNFLFVMCIFNLLDVASFQEPSPAPGGPAPKPVSYYHASATGELGVRFTFNPPTNKAMHVIISYESEGEAEKTFFKTQLTTALVDKFTKCSTVALFFLPCSKTKLENGVLTCGLGPNKCNYYKNMFHSCVTDQLKNDRVNLAKFIICTFSAPIDQCPPHGVSDPPNPINEQAVHTCIQNHVGDKLCDQFHTEIENEKKRNPNAHPLAGEKVQDATTDFKNVVCSYLAQANLRCDAACK